MADVLLTMLRFDTTCDADVEGVSPVRSNTKHKRGGGDDADTSARGRTASSSHRWRLGRGGERRDLRGARVRRQARCWWSCPRQDVRMRGGRSRLPNGRGTPPPRSAFATARGSAGRSRSGSTRGWSSSPGRSPLEQGKPLSEALGEVEFAAGLYRDAGGYVERLATAVLPSPDPHKRVLTMRQPHGVVAVITPRGTTRSGIPSEYLSAALAAGNAGGSGSRRRPRRSSRQGALRVPTRGPAPPEGACNLLFGGQGNRRGDRLRTPARTRSASREASRSETLVA